MDYSIAFLLSQYRTGSHMLCSALHSHPEIVCDHETLHKREVGKFVDYLDVAEELHSKFPSRPIVVLHGHYDMLSEDVHMAKVPKVHLYSRDYVLGAVTQCMLNGQRVQGQFELNSDIVEDCKQLRIKRDKELSIYTDHKVCFEDITNGKIVDSIPLSISIENLLKDLLHFLSY